MTRRLTTMVGAPRCCARIEVADGQRVAKGGKLYNSTRGQQCSRRAVADDGFCHQHGQFARMGFQARWCEPKDAGVVS